ncbi:hypothetical protein CCP2SC5_2090001 [Azospirillaceae bacterium]
MVFETLPIITVESARAWLEEAGSLLPLELRPATLAGSRTAQSVATSALLAGTFEAVREALAFIPNADLDYNNWMRIGMALKGALGEKGETLFSVWSAQSVKNVPDFTAKSWTSFHPTKIGAGTLYRAAMDFGWKPDPSVVLDGSLPQGGPHPAAAFLARLEAVSNDPPPFTPPKVEPLTIAPPGGILGDMVSYMLATARRPQPELALGAGLCALGALMGRKYRTETNLRSNLYIIGIGGSGSGKNHPREVVNELLVAAGLGRYLGGNKIASGAGLLSALYRQPALLMQIDEFGMFLQSAADRKRSPKHITDILDNMTELYTSAGGIFLGAEYSNLDGKNERRDINQPCLCVYGTTAPIHFWSALQSANVVDGSLARFIIIHCANDYPDENEAAGIRKTPSALIEALNLIASGGGHTPSGNLCGLTSTPVTSVDPMTVKMDADAKNAFRALSRSVTIQLREARDTPFTPILARIAENAAKIALVRAVSHDPVAPVIGADDAEWGISFVQWSANRMMAETERCVSDNHTERNHKKVLEIIRSVGSNGVTKSALILASRFLERRQREEILAELMEAGLVQLEKRSTATKPIMVFVAVDTVE